MDALDTLSIHCAALNIQKAARAINQIYNKTLKPSGLRITQLAILTSAARLDSPTLTSMASDLGMDRTSLSRGLGPLERSGLLRIVPGRDRRTRRVHLTPQGQAAIESALPSWRTAQAEIQIRVGAREFEETVARVAALTEVLSSSGATESSPVADVRSMGDLDEQD